MMPLDVLFIHRSAELLHVAGRHLAADQAAEDRRCQGLVAFFAEKITVNRQRTPLGRCGRHELQGRFKEIGEGNAIVFSHLSDGSRVEAQIGIVDRAVWEIDIHVPLIGRR